MTIKELEKRSGLPRTAIRFYEQQGLITPQRRENNYRDYSEEDARTLEKVKLLRQLSLDLEAIRALKEGSLSLAQAMERQAEVLEGDRADLERYARVCRELSQAQTDYDSLEPGPWLEELSQTELPPTRRVDPAREDGLRGPHPWRRFWARYLDLMLMTLVWQVLQFQVLHWYMPTLWFRDQLQTAVSVGLSWVLLLLVEPILLCTWGYTPGKWLLGLRVRRLDTRLGPGGGAAVFGAVAGTGAVYPSVPGVAQLDVLCGLHRRETTALGEGEPLHGPAHSPGPLGGLGGLLGCYDGPVRCEPAVEPGAALSRRTVDSHRGSGELQFL